MWQSIAIARCCTTYGSNGGPSVPSWHGLWSLACHGFVCWVLVLRIMNKRGLRTTWWVRTARSPPPPCTDCEKTTNRNMLVLDEASYWAEKLLTYVHLPHLHLRIPDEDNGCSFHMMTSHANEDWPLLQNWHF